jgi:hypothetical protein
MLVMLSGERNSKDLYIYIYIYIYISLIIVFQMSII